MLPYRSKRNIFTDISGALGNLPLDIGQAVIIEHNNKSLIGYYAGSNQQYTKIGLKKKEGWLYWKFDPFKADKIAILTDNMERQWLKKLSIDEQLNNLNINEPVEIVFKQEYDKKFNEQFKLNEQVVAGIIGYWNGKTRYRINYLNFYLDTEKNIYENMSETGDVSQLSKDNIIPKISKIIEINPLLYLNIN